VWCVVVMVLPKVEAPMLLLLLLMMMIMPETHKMVTRQHQNIIKITPQNMATHNTSYR
jgi:hypothetical protein